MTTLDDAFHAQVNRFRRKHHPAASSSRRIKRTRLNQECSSPEYAYDIPTQNSCKSQTGKPPQSHRASIVPFLILLKKGDGWYDNFYSDKAHQFLSFNHIRLLYAFENRPESMTLESRGHHFSKVQSGILLKKLELRKRRNKRIWSAVSKVCPVSEDMDNDSLRVLSPVLSVKSRGIGSEPPLYGICMLSVRSEFQRSNRGRRTALEYAGAAP